MSWLPAAIGAGGSIIGGLIGSSGQSSANKKNIALAREQMRFQERMSSTAYTRAAKNMEEAGLNRILALGSPASSPAGARATMLNPKAAMAEGVASAPSSALAAKVQSEQLKQMRAATAQLQTQSELNNAGINESYARVKEILERTKIHSAQAVIQGTQSQLYGALGPALVAAEKLLPSLAPIFKVIRGRIRTK